MGFIGPRAQPVLALWLSVNRPHIVVTDEILPYSAVDFVSRFLINSCLFIIKINWFFFLVLAPLNAWLLVCHSIIHVQINLI